MVGIHALVFEDWILDYEKVIGIAKQNDERIVPFDSIGESVPL